MGQAEYRETEAKSVLNPVKGMGFHWSINPYRGCTHGCHYCFARRYHAYFELTPGDDFTGIIFVKVNAPVVLRAELSRPSWRCELVAIGTATDPYQPIEGRYRLMRGILEALRDARTPASIVTKGPMVIRDVEALQGLRDAAGATVCMSMTTLDRERWRRLEPGTAPPMQRLRAVARLASAGIHVGVLVAPVIPGITADRENLEAVVQAAADHGAAFLGARALHLHPGVKEHFTAFLTAEAPGLLPLYRRLYPGAYPSAQAQALIDDRIEELRERFRLKARPPAMGAPGPDAGPAPSPARTEKTAGAVPSGRRRPADAGPVQLGLDV
jgi:DNA repair photolyase